VIAIFLQREYIAYYVAAFAAAQEISPLEFHICKILKASFQDNVLFYIKNKPIEDIAQGKSLSMNNFFSSPCFQAQKRHLPRRTAPVDGQECPVGHVGEKGRHRAAL
jgi:hypothetical protein